MKEQTRFWFVHAKAQNPTESVALAVAAFTERSARRQVRRTLGKGFVIVDVSPIPYPHAWVVNLVWRRKAEQG